MLIFIHPKDEFEDIKRVITRSCKLGKDRHYNVQKKKDKRTNNYLQNTTQKTKDLYINTKHYIEN